MSCNGCRVLRKGCSDSCVLRPCLHWIQTPEAQGHATVFVAKFFGRAGLMSFISNVPDSQRPALFQSLLYEACGRTVNPVSGAVGLLWTGNWQICQAAVDTVLRGGALRPLPEFLNAAAPDSDEASEVVCPSKGRFSQDSKSVKRQKSRDRSPKSQLVHLDLTSANPDFPAPDVAPAKKMRRPATPSLNSEESGTTISFESVYAGDQLRRPAPVQETKLLNLFV